MLFSQGMFQALLMKNCFSLFGQSPLQLQVDTSEGFRQHTTFYHHLPDHLLCAYTHAFDRLTFVLMGSTININQILIFDLVKPISLM